MEKNKINSVDKDSNSGDNSSHNNSLSKKYHVIRDSIFPTGSKRRFVAKLAKKFVKNPGFYFRQLNMENIRKLKYYAPFLNEKKLFDENLFYKFHILSFSLISFVKILSIT